MTPPVHEGKPMPSKDPMFASATLVSTPSSRHLTASIASANSIRSCMSRKGMCVEPESNDVRTPGQIPVLVPDSS
ncbi:hypothetical protein ASG84_24315 [Rhodococcus sp. Leaf278]|nr:hypothetical protein ASG84_24315 [Rhodococcus sp. Leaf278]